MISTRHMYSSDLEFFRRNDRGIPMSLGQNPHIPDQYETSSHLSSRTTPSSEPDSRASSGARKRVPVACQRCRQRKIKCSGNEGDNQSCTNCKNSGHQDTCRFSRVCTIDPATICLRGGWQTPSRFSPYGFPPNHRLNCMPVSSRYHPQNALQYSNVSTNLDFAGYPTPAPSVDWTRASYVGPYSPYPDDEHTSPYTSQPPPYILPNTDPMSATNGYYLQHAQSVRPQPGSQWPESQQCMTAQGTQLPSSAYPVAADTAQSFHATGISGGLPPNRILPTPVAARSVVVSTQGNNPMDGLPMSSSNQRNSSYWTSETGAPAAAHQVSPQMEAVGGPGQADEGRGGASYKMQGMSYSHINLGEGLPPTSLPPGHSLAVHEMQTSPTAVSPSDSQPQCSGMSSASRESLKSTPDTASVTYGYTASMLGRGSQSRSASSQQLSNGSLYARTPSMVPLREPAPDDCGPDCSSCQTDSTRASISSISNTSSGYWKPASDLGAATPI